MAIESNTLEALLNEHQVAELLNVSIATIRRRRLFRQPPDFVKIGASVRYKRDTIQRMIDGAEQHMEGR